MMSNENVQQPQDAEVQAHRTQFFEQVALAVLNSRPAVVVKGSPEGKILSPEFLAEVTFITEGILKAAKTFGEK